MAGAECVRAPTESLSTPNLENSLILSIVKPPEISNRTLGEMASRFIMAAAASSGVKLSSKIQSGCTARASVS